MLHIFHEAYIRYPIIVEVNGFQIFQTFQARKIGQIIIIDIEICKLFQMLDICQLHICQLTVGKIKLCRIRRKYFPADLDFCDAVILYPMKHKYCGYAQHCG